MTDSDAAPWPEEGAPNATTAFARVLVDELTRHGVTDAVLAPGSRSTPVALALLAHPGIRLHVRIDERSAAYLALGIAKASRTVVPVLTTSGTATSYLLGAALEADLSAVPLLLLTADRPPELRGIGANQTIDQVGMFGSAVRWAVDVGVPESRPDSVRHWRSLVSQAVAAAMGWTGPGGRSGPVHLNVALREPLTPAEDGVGFPWSTAGRTGTAGGAPGGMGRRWTRTDGAGGRVPVMLQRQVARAARGVLVAGDLPYAAWDTTDLAERAGWPVIAEPQSGMRQGPNVLRTSDALLVDERFTDGHRPELVVVAGRVQLSRALLGWLETVPHVVIDPAGRWWDVTRTARSVMRCLVSDLDALEVAEPDPAWLGDWTAAADRAGDAMDAVLDAGEMLTEPRTARDVVDLLPDNAVLAVSSSMPIRDLDLVMRPRALTVIANRGVSGIDGFVSTAQGVALSRTFDGPTVALCGDLSLLHDSNGLLPGPDRRPDITYVVINNDGGGIFSLLPQSDADDRAGFERVFGTPHGMSIERFAAAYDTSYLQVSTAAELAAALSAESLSAPGVRIVEVRTDRTANAALHRRLREVAAAAVGSGT